MQGAFDVWAVMTRSRLAPLLVLTAFLAACGGGGGGGDPVPPPPAAPVITQQPASASVQAGVTATFNVGLQDATGASYQWLRDGAAVAGANQASHAVASTRIADTGSKWSVRVSNAGGTVTSAEAVLTVTMPAVIVPPVGISVVKANLSVVTAAGTDAAGNTLFVHYEPAGTDWNLVLRKMAPDGTLLSNGPSGQGIVVAQGRFTEEAQFGRTGSAFDAAGNLYLAKATYAAAGSINNFPLTGGSISRVAPDGMVTKLVEWPAGSAGAMSPLGPAVGPDGTLYFVDQLSGNLVAWTAPGGTRVVANLRAPQFNAFFARAAHIVVTPDHRIYVMDDNLLKRVDGNTMTTIAGGPATGLSVAVDGTGSEARFQSVDDMELDSAGNLLVADGPTIRRVTPSGVVATVAGVPGRPASIATYPPLQEGPLTNSLGLKVGPIALGADGIVHAFVFPTAQSYPGLGPGQPGDQTLVKIRFQ